MSQTILTHTDNPAHAPYLQAVQENSRLENELKQTRQALKHQTAQRNAADSSKAAELYKLDSAWSAEAERLEAGWRAAAARCSELEAERELEPGSVEIGKFDLWTSLLLALVAGIAFGVMAGNAVMWTPL